MVDVQTAPGPVAQTYTTFEKIGMWWSDNWWIILLIVSVMVVIAIIWILASRVRELAKPRDEPAYQKYKEIMSSCSQNANRKYINKKFNLKFLFVPPLFWLGFLFETDYSTKLRDKDGHMIGYYRGDFKSKNGIHYFTFYKKKSWFIVEDIEILMVPIYIQYKDSNGNDKIKFFDLISKLRNHDIQVDCLGVELSHNYYHPVLYDIDQKPVDISNFTNAVIRENTHEVMMHRVLNQGALAAEKAINHNPYLKYAQRVPEKTKEEEELDEKTG